MSALAAGAAAGGAAAASAISPEVLGSIISSASASGMGGLGFLVNQNQSSLSYSRQRRLMEYQNQLYLQNLAEDREYNSPINTMARYKEAGLNPNLIYGNGTEAATGFGPSSSAPAMSQLQLNGLSLLDDYLKIQQAKDQHEESVARVGLINSQAKKNEGEESRASELHSFIKEDYTLKNQLSRLGIRSQEMANDLQAYVQRNQELLSDLSVVQMRQAVQQGVRNTMLLDEQIKSARYGNQFARRTLNARIRKVQLENSELSEAIQKYKDDHSAFEARFGYEISQAQENLLKLQTENKLLLDSLGVYRYENVHALDPSGNWITPGFERFWRDWDRSVGRLYKGILFK